MWINISTDLHAFSRIQLFRDLALDTIPAYVDHLVEYGVLNVFGKYTYVAC